MSSSLLLSGIMLKESTSAREGAHANRAPHDLKNDHKAHCITAATALLACIFPSGSMSDEYVAGQLFKNTCDIPWYKAWVTTDRFVGCGV